MIIQPQLKIGYEKHIVHYFFFYINKNEYKKTHEIKKKQY